MFANCTVDVQISIYTNEVMQVYLFEAVQQFEFLIKWEKVQQGCIKEAYFQVEPDSFLGRGI